MRNFPCSGPEPSGEVKGTNNAQVARHTAGQEDAEDSPSPAWS